MTSPFAQPFICLLRLYQKHISPLKGSPSCRFTPCCSQYAITALSEWGLIVGSALSLWRILRCNPFSKGGTDEVPRRRRKNVKQSPENNISPKKD